MVILRPYRTDDRAWVYKSNVEFYRTVHGFDETFDTAVANALDLLETQLPDANSTYLIAQTAAGPAGCIFFSSETMSAGRIRLFYLDEACRGQGIGKRMLGDILVAAGRTDFKLVRVSTFDRHPEACRLYERFGFEPVAENRVEAFGRSMRQLDYELSLAGKGGS